MFSEVSMIICCNYLTMWKCTENLLRENAEKGR